MTNNSILPLSGGVSQATSAVSSSLEISTQDFLKLLVAQSKYQDPLSPKDPGDTLQQLASLAGVSGLQDIKKTLERFLSSQNMLFDAASWIGRSALVPSTTALPLADGQYAGAIASDGAASIDVAFADASGVVLHTEHIAGPVTGRVDFHWDGLIDGAAYKGPVTISATTDGPPAIVAVWTSIESVRAPAQNNPVIETPLGAFLPAAVLDLK
ncbi:MAG TPA: flagellar hook capping FlgD N-terminal domain-containing protein [Oxalicibacterium sp.]